MKRGYCVTHVVSTNFFSNSTNKAKAEQPFFRGGRNPFNKTPSIMKNVLRLCIALALLGAIGCSDDCEDRAADPVYPHNIDYLRTFDIEGEAFGTIPADSTHPERTITCLCDLHVELDTTEEGEWSGDTLVLHGTAGGTFRRYVLNPDESGFGLEPDVYSEVIVKLFAPDSIVFIFPPNINDITPFYREVAFLRGRVGARDWGKGSWNCAPFNIDRGGGETDSVGVATGPWEIDD